MEDNNNNILIVGGIIVIIGAIFLWMLAGYPIWKVWSAEKSGEAALMKAKQTRQITVEAAKAERDSSILKAEAIEIMGEAAKKYPEYRQQEFISAFGEALREGNISQIIYVPTEANLPILEAGKR